MAPSSRAKKVSFLLDDDESIITSNGIKPPRVAARSRASKIRCFNGLTRRTTDWDGLKKDEQLWVSDGDCMVYFGNREQASVEPCMCLPLKHIESLDCDFLLQHCLQASNDDSADDSGYSSRSESSSKAAWELHIPTPSELTPSEVVKYKLTTRNLLAYAASSPIAGERLGTALLDLWHRLKTWQVAGVTRQSLVAYLEEQGYLNFSENAEHALACLKLAEEARLPDVWVNAFAHCVGMNDRLDLSPEFAGLNHVTSDVITRASLEMDLNVSRITRSLSDFLEEELGPENLGLPRPGREHLDRFRSFLHSYYVNKLGYFPPRSDHPWNKRLWVGIRHDFQCLHDYLVDIGSNGDLASNRHLDGGICVLQNIQAFDTRHQFTPLPHPLPLMPEAQSPTRKHSAVPKSVRDLRRRSLLFTEVECASTDALSAAANSSAGDRTGSALLPEYQRFERERMTEKLDLVEARKVRWLLIYGTLQMLNSVMQAPDQVDNDLEVSYPLCIPTKSFPHWLDATPDLETHLIVDTSPLGGLFPPTDDFEEPPTGRSSRISIHPDCEAETAEDFFANQSPVTGPIPRSASQTSLTKFGMPFHSSSAPAARTNSLRSSVHSLHRSVVGSLTRRSSSRRHSIQSDIGFMRTSPCATVEENDVVELDSRHIVIPERQSSRLSLPLLSVSPVDIEEKAKPAVVASLQADVDALAGFDFGLAPNIEEPTLKNHQLDVGDDSMWYHNGEALHSPDESQTTSRSDSTRSSTSYQADDDDDGDSEEASSPSSVEDSYWEDQTYQDRSKQTGTLLPILEVPAVTRDVKRLSVNAGTYIPTGSPVSRPSSLIGSSYPPRARQQQQWLAPPFHDSTKYQRFSNDRQFYPEPPTMRVTDIDGNPNWPKTRLILNDDHYDFA